VTARDGEYRDVRIHHGRTSAKPKRGRGSKDFAKQWYKGSELAYLAGGTLQEVIEACGARKPDSHREQRTSYHRPMLFLPPLIVRAVARVLVLPGAADGTKDLEILVLRQQLRPLIMRMAGRSLGGAA